MLAPLSLNNLSPLTQIRELLPVSTTYCVCVCVHEGTTITAPMQVLPLISIFRLFKKEKEKLLFMPEPS